MSRALTNHNPFDKTKTNNKGLMNKSNYIGRSNMLCVYEKWRLWQDWHRLFNAFVVWQCNKYENLMSHQWPFCFCSLYLTLCMQCKFFILFLLAADFFKIYFFKKFFQELYQRVKQFGSRSGPNFWFQTVCKGYQQTTKVTPSKERVNSTFFFFSIFFFQKKNQDFFLL